MKKMKSLQGMKRAFSRMNAALGMFMLNSVAMAADTHGSYFDSLHSQLIGWIEGSLGKSIALIFLLIGLGVGAMRGSILGAVTCIAAALSLAIAPGIVDSIFVGS